MLTGATPLGLSLSATANHIGSDLHKLNPNGPTGTTGNEIAWPTVRGPPRGIGTGFVTYLKTIPPFITDIDGLEVEPFVIPINVT